MNDESNEQALHELLPWYLNGTLETAEAAQVEAWLERSVEARSALEELRALASAVRLAEQARQAETPPPSELGWARLQRSLQQEPRVAPRRDWWKPSLAAAAALVVALQLGILMRPPAPMNDWTLQSGNSAQQQRGEGYRLQLRFVDQASWPQVRALLLDLDGLLVDGPSVLGTVQVHVPLDVKRFADGPALLTWLQQQPVVQHAALLEPPRP
ncbi:MAG: hypothetical protein ABWY06_17645 [Pseudomonas sp.]|uniref:anti-sigma factor family protein n=1 Tax=Pseudomonas sp. TaxID=306 RepID=UPI003396EE97